MYGRMNMYGELNDDEKERECAAQPKSEPVNLTKTPPAMDNMPPVQPQQGPPVAEPVYQNPYGQVQGNPASPMPGMPGMQSPVQVQAIRVPAFGEKLEQMMNHFGFFGLGCLLYGILFAICIYPGFHGVSVVVISAVTMAGLVKVCHVLGIPLKKSTWFYFVSWGLLSVSSMLTGSKPVLTFNTCGMYLLFLSFLFSHFCRVEKWRFAKYLGQIFIAPFVSMGYLYCPFQSLRRYMNQKEKEKSTTMQYVWIGIAISLPVLFVLTMLLTSADAVFRSLLEKLLCNIRFPAHPFWMLLLLFVGIGGSYGLLAYLADGKIADEAVEKLIF